MRRRVGPELELDDERAEMCRAFAPARRMEWWARRNKIHHEGGASEPLNEAESRGHRPFDWIGFCSDPYSPVKRSLRLPPGALKF